MCCLMCWTYHCLDLEFKTRMCLKFCVCVSFWACNRLCVCVCVCAKARTCVSTCVTVDVLSKGLHRSVRGPLIRRSVTRLLSTALEMGGCVPGGTRCWLDMDETVDLTRTHTHTDKQNKRAASFKCDTSRPQSELKRRSIGQCRCLCTNVCVPMPVCVFVSQNVITRLEMTSKNKPLYMVSKLGRLRLTVALKYCHTTSSVCAYLYFSVLNTAAVW